MTTTKYTEQQKEVFRIKSPMLWNIKKGKAQNTFFATMHAYPNACESLPKVIYEKLGRSKVLWVEDEATAHTTTSSDKVPAFDICLIEHARKANIPVKGLESLDTANENLANFAKLSKVCGTNSKEAIAQDFVDMLIDYQYGNRYKLYKSSVEQCPDFYKQFVEERNKKWMEKLPAILERGGAFVAAGALHFAGPASLLESIQGVGFRVSDAPSYSADEGRAQLLALEPAKDLSCKENTAQTPANTEPTKSKEGGLTKEEIEAVIRKNLAKIKDCYEKNTSDEEGRIKVDFKVMPAGCVASVGINKTSNFPNPKVARCMQSEILYWNFPKPKGGSTVDISYPFVFSMSSREPKSTSGDKAND